jgi:hypothetical protein
MTRDTAALLTPAASAITRILTKSLMINSFITKIMTRQANITVLFDSRVVSANQAPLKVQTAS